jgi:hypothetical protein
MFVAFVEILIYAVVPQIWPSSIEKSPWTSQCVCAVLSLVQFVLKLCSFCSIFFAGTTGSIKEIRENGGGRNRSSLLLYFHPAIRAFCSQHTERKIMISERFACE